MVGKSKKLKIKKLQINLTNRWLYTLIVFFSLVVIGVFVYAVAPNPGHDITQIAPPSACSDNQFLKWTGSAWACADVTASSGETDPFWSGNETNVTFLNKANAFGAFNQTFDTSTLFIDSVSNRVGIRTTSPDYSLDVNSSVRAKYFIGDGSGLMNIIVRVTLINDVCSGDNDGLLRYRSSYCAGDDQKKSSFDICMRTGDTTYSWHTLESYSWTDFDCDIDGCIDGQEYYECNGWYVEPGCYSSEPQNCYTPPSY